MKKVFLLLIIGLASITCLIGSANSNRLLLDSNHNEYETSINYSPGLTLKTKKNWEKKAEKFINKYIKRDAKGLSIVIGCAIGAAILLFIFIGKKDRSF